MRLDHPLLYKFAALLGSTAVRAWMDTLDYRVLFYDPDVDPASPRCRGQKIYIFWHEYILFPFAMRGNCDLAMLLSRHRDAEVLSYAARLMGFDFVRGSTNRGGAAALRQLLEKSRQAALGDHARRPPRAPPPTCAGSGLSWPPSWAFPWWRWESATTGPGGRRRGTASPSPALAAGHIASSHRSCTCRPTWTATAWSTIASRSSNS